MNTWTEIELCYLMLSNTLYHRDMKMVSVLANGVIIFPCNIKNFDIKLFSSWLATSCSVGKEKGNRLFESCNQIQYLAIRSLKIQKHLNNYWEMWSSALIMFHVLVQPQRLVKQFTYSLFFTPEEKQQQNNERCLPVHFP